MIGEDRCQAILIVGNREETPIRKIAVDAKTRKPDWEQFIDVTYNLDEPVTSRVIVHDDPAPYDYDFVEPSILSNLVSRNNRCGIDTWLVQLNYDPDGKDPSIKYVFDEKARRFDSLPYTLPTRKEIEVAQFWVEHYIKMPPTAIDGPTLQREVNPPERYCA